MAECDISCFEEKRGFADCECFALKENALNLNHRINSSPCKQVITIKRIKKKTNKKKKDNNFLKEEQQFHHETGQ